MGACAPGAEDAETIGRQLIGRESLAQV